MLQLGLAHLAQGCAFDLADDGRFVVVNVKTAPIFTFTAPVVIPRGFGPSTPTEPRTFDMLPDGQTFEGKGIPPEVEVNEPVSAYAKADPTLEKALELLRQKVADKATP